MDEGQRELTELCRLARMRGETRFSRFLNLAQQREGEIAARKQGVCFALFGGRDDSERKILGVGIDAPPETGEFPIACVKIAPRGARFAKPLEHRDVLGSLMGLGIERDVTGDILTIDGAAYVFCLPRMAEYIVASLEKVGNAFVDCSIADPPDGSGKSTRIVRVQVASTRLDAVVAHLFKLSRCDAQALFRQNKVAVDDSVCTRCDYILKPDQVISVRGYGRARYTGVENQSKKGKYNLTVELYQ